MTRTAIEHRLHRLRMRVQFVRNQVKTLRDTVALDECDLFTPDEELVIQLGESLDALNAAMRCLSLMQVSDASAQTPEGRGVLRFDRQRDF